MKHKLAISAFIILAGVMCYTVMYEPEPVIVTVDNETVYELHPGQTLDITTKPKYIVHKETGYVFVEVEKLVKVIKEVPVEKIVERYRDVRPFQSREELETWLANLEHRTYTWGEISFSNLDCDDAVMSRVYQANRDGYLVLSDIKEGNPPHIMLLVPVPAENKFYYVDNFKIVGVRGID